MSNKCFKKSIDTKQLYDIYLRCNEGRDVYEYEFEKKW